MCYAPNPLQCDILAASFSPAPEAFNAPGDFVGVTSPDPFFGECNELLGLTGAALV
ncbi:hypothetical protein DPMN_026810 [Dreissena polymorpha]|uniref:Uncharacterized protein n=1 Tax=Dreissena polymorpha TaxID=45954 RepID=A0A9D4LRZ7_DREPO|nr:hypothetical protein DPMN_026810 [Dreissena polymorpha]